MVFMESFTQRLRTWVAAVSFAGLLPVCAWGTNGLVVASLNPIATDMARQLGGERVRIVELVAAGKNPHHYQPSPSDLRDASGARLFLAMGKKLETYLPRIRDNLGPDQKIVEIGSLIPSLELGAEDAAFTCCPSHTHGGIDPHWWNSIKNMQRGARALSRALVEADPGHEEYYAEQYRRYDARLGELYRWAKREINRIPRRDRNLSTPHAAFNYFCKEFGFKAVPIKGLTTEEDVQPAHLAHVADTIRREGIKVVFPEGGSDKVFLDAMVKETGVRIGGELLAGTLTQEAPTYEAMMRSNVKALVNALAPSEE